MKTFMQLFSFILIKISQRAEALQPLWMNPKVEVVYPAETLIATC